MSIKFIYSEKATKFCEIFTLLLSYVVAVKSKVKISQNFVAFSECINFTCKIESMVKKKRQKTKLACLFIREFRKRSMYMDYTTAATL